MIQKVDIKKFGVFENYLWDTSIGKSETFRKLNILYGRNYSGKTTLARIFKCIEDQRLHANYLDCDFSVLLTSGKTITPRNLSDFGVDKKIRVYNTDFVRENLAWLHNEDGTIKPFTVLGAKNIELEKKISDILEAIGSIETKKGLQFDISEKIGSCQRSKKRYDDLDSGLENKLSIKAKAIKTNTAIYNTPVYSITHLRTDIAKATSQAIFSDSQTDDKKKLLKEDPKEVITRLPETRPNFSSYYSQTTDLLQRQIRPNQPIIDLVNDSLLQEWARQGIEKHKGKRKDCGFCGNTLSPELWDKLDAHFSKESEEFRDELDKLIKALEVAKVSLNNFLPFNKDAFYLAFGLKYDELAGQWGVSAKSYSNAIEVLILRLKERLQNIFEKLDLEEMIDGSDTIFALLKEFNQLIDENNLRTKSLATDQQKTRVELRISDLAKYLKDIDYPKQLKEIADSLSDFRREQEEQRNLQTKLFKLNEEKRECEAQAKDESKGAELVNRHLSHFFGHGELKLVAENNAGIIKFNITRGNTDAKNLSEGECSLISFCYFIAKMEDEMKDAVNNGNLMIYIDDPISSLDSNHIFFMFSLIESVITKKKNYGQLFISTHNLDFLKYLKKLTMPKSKLITPGKEKLDFNQFMIERKNKISSDLKLSPDYLKKYITEFNYLFNEVYVCATSDDATISHHYQYNFGNNMRKFLEAYLFYRYPSQNLSLGQKLDKFLDDDQVSVNLINRVINEYSHLEDHADRSLEPIDVDAISKIAKTVIAKIQAKDPDQYYALLDSIGIKHVLLLPAITQAAEVILE